MACRFGIEQNPDSFTRTRGENDCARLNHIFPARSLIDVDNAIGSAGGIERYFAHVGITKNVEIAGR